MLQPAAHFQSICQVAVVPQREFAFIAVDDHRLRIDHRVVAGRRIARVSDRHWSGQFRQHIRRENFLHQPEALVEVQFLSVGRCDARRFLPAMLQRIQSEIGEFCRFGVANDAENAAVIAKVIVFEDMNLGNHALSSVSPSESLHVRRKESTLPCITAAPSFPLSYWMRNPCLTTVPIRVALTPYCAAISETRAREPGARDTTARAPRSPNIAASAGIVSAAAETCFELTFTSAQSSSESLVKQHSASVTASPPSLMSCAEATTRSLLNWTRQSIRRFSAFRSMLGRALRLFRELFLHIRTNQIRRHHFAVP